MDNQKVYIHVGLSKCASTFLQKNIFPQLGNYADIAFSPARDKYYLFRNDMEPDVYREIVIKNIINPDQRKKWLIVSCEDYTEFLFRGFEDVFFDWEAVERNVHIHSNKIITENISRAFPYAKIILIIREQLSWAVSRYKMNYRGGKTSASIDDLMAEAMEGYDVMVDRYQKCFGKENVLVLPYELLQKNQNAFLKYLTDFIDHDIELNITSTKINTAPVLKRTVEYEREKNCIRLKINHKKNLTPVIRFLFRLLARLSIGISKPLFYLKYRSKRYSVQPNKSTIEKLKPFFIKTNNRLQELVNIDLSEYGYLFEKPEN